jgi:BirA family biotin operon repressor/biotin-[acetyl-CoA-carboxylase] ligase
MIAGLALVRACSSWAADSGARFREPLRLKWPNDALCGDRKLAGILCEAAGGTIYAGIGINRTQEVFPQGLRTEPTSILLETGSGPSAGELLERLVASFRDLRGEGGRWKDEYESLLAWRGMRVRFRPGIDEDPIEGVIRGVDDSGAILIAPDGLSEAPSSAYHSGELLVRY